MTEVKNRDIEIKSERKDFDSQLNNALLSSCLGIYCQKREVWSGCMKVLLDYCRDPNRGTDLETFLTQLLSVEIKDRETKFLTLENRLKRDNVSEKVYKKNLEKLLEECHALAET